MTDITLNEIFGLLGVAGILFSIFNSINSRRQQTDSSARETATIIAELKHVTRELESLRGQVSGFNSCLMDMATRLGATEKAVERAHVRIDKLEVNEP